MESWIAYLQDPDTPLGVMDLVFGLYIAYGLIRGLFRGLPAELSGILGTLITFVGAWKFYGPVSAFMLQHTRVDSEAGSRALAYVLVAVTFLTAWKLVTWALRKALDWTCPRQIRAPGGGLLGMGKSTLVLCVVLMAVDLSGHAYLHEHLIARSAFGRFTREHAPAALEEWMPGLFPPSAPDDDGSGNA